MRRLAIIDLDKFDHFKNMLDSLSYDINRNLDYYLEIIDNAILPITPDINKINMNKTKDEITDILNDCRIQLEYIDKMLPTGTTSNVLSRVKTFLQEYEKEETKIEDKVEKNNKTNI